MGCAFWHYRAAPIYRKVGHADCGNDFSDTLWDKKKKRRKYAGYY